MQREVAGAVRTIRAIGNTVVVRPILDPETTASGLIKPKTARARSALMLGEVVSVGIGHYTRGGALVPIDLEKGDMVLFKRTYGELVFGDADETVEYRVLDRPDVVAHVVDTDRVDVGMEVKTTRSPGEAENLDDQLAEQMSGLVKEAQDSGREPSTKTITHKRASER